MPKMKSNRGAAKRFRATGSGRIKRKRAFHSHILTKKDTKRQASSARDCSGGEVGPKKSVRRMLPKL